MEPALYSIYDPAAHRILLEGVLALDAPQDPLRALQVMLDGPALHASAGVWAAPFQAIAFVPRLAAYDIVYLNANERIVELCELDPGAAYPAYTQTPASILLLPPKTIATTEMKVGDKLVFYVPSEPGGTPSQELIAAATSGKPAAEVAQGAPVDPASFVPPLPLPPAPPPPSKSPLLRLLRWVDPKLVTPPELRASARRTSPDLVAYSWAKGIAASYPVGDLSSTGIYLLTEERWPIGEQVTLVLQREGPIESDLRRQVTMHSEVVRYGDQGIGLRFLLPLGMSLQLWDTAHPSHPDMSKPEYVVDEIRSADALAFLLRICPQASAGLRSVMQKELGVGRSEAAVDILLLAQDMLLRDPKCNSMRIHPAIVLRILETGSWAEFDFIKQFWAGLLVSSCTLDGLDTSNLPHIDTLSLLRPVHFHLLADVCTRQQPSGANNPAIYDCTPDELTKITGTADLTPIYRAIGLLGELGLIVRDNRSTYSFGEKVRLVPTDAGHLLLTRCIGQRAAP
jgi:hypothetical protein